MSPSQGGIAPPAQQAVSTNRTHGHRVFKESPWKSWILALLLAGAIVYGGMYLFGIQFAEGEVYPEFSSLRTDPRGTRLLYDSLAALPGVTVERNYRALEFLPDGGDTVLLIAAPAAVFAEGTEPYLRNMEENARRGNRMVAALYVDPSTQALIRSDPGKLPKFEEIAKKWGVKVALDDKGGRPSIYFSDAPGWDNLYRIGPKLLVIQKSFGKGSIVLFASSDRFTNGALAENGELSLITIAIGGNTHIVFDEQHLGIVDTGSVVALARRFHLLGFGAGLAICAALIFWRNGMDFPPPAHARASGRLTGRTSHSGLVTLLRRHIPPRQVAAACWQEWLNGNRGKVTPERLHQATAVLAGASDPVEALAKVQAVLHSKGEL